MTDIFDTHISYEKCEKAKDGLEYTKKNLSFDNGIVKNITTPIKTIDMDCLTKDSLPFLSRIKEPLIFDQPKNIWHPQSYTSINEINEGYINDIQRFLNILSLKPSLYNKISNSIAVSSISFHRNPFKERITSNGRKYSPLNLDNFDTFLQNLYSYSKRMVLVPDINITRLPKQGYTITVDEYIELIEHFTTVLSDRNKKPILLPIQTNLTKKTTNKIIDFYCKNKYSNIWVNFSAGEVRGRNLSGFRIILNLLDKKFGKNYFIFCTHMKKEISPDIKDVKTASSDMLSQFVGGDVIGGTREPPRIIKEGDLTEYIAKKGFSNKQEYIAANIIHKNRIFDSDSYYYINPYYHPNLPDIFSKNEILHDLNKNKLLNNFIRLNEVEKIKTIFDKDKKIKNHLKSKDIFSSNEDLANAILNVDNKKKGQSLFDF